MKFVRILVFILTLVTGFLIGRSYESQKHIGYISQTGEVSFTIPGAWWVDENGDWHKLADECKDKDKVYFLDNSKPLPSMIINRDGATLIGLEPCHPLFSVIEPDNKGW
jgi:hypothetical protein